MQAFTVSSLLVSPTAQFDSAQFVRNISAAPTNGPDEDLSAAAGPLLPSVSQRSDHTDH